MGERFRLKREFDAVAILTLIVGAFIAIIQIEAHYRGPDIKLYAPDGVAFIIEKYPNGEFYLRIAARMAYSEPRVTGL